MIFQTKYNPQDIVFFIENNVLWAGTIYKASASGDEKLTNVSYILLYGKWDLAGKLENAQQTTKLESQVFESEQALKDSLKPQYDPPV